VPGNLRESVYAQDLPATTPHGRGSRWHRDASFVRLI
jgi:hypothetical protein